MYLLGSSGSYLYYSGPVYFQPPFSFTRSGGIQKLNQNELSTVLQTIANGQWGKNECATNVALQLGGLPDTIVNKLKVVLTTHELKPLSYYGSEYLFHVFLLGNTEDGLRIFDVASPSGINNDPGRWLNRAFDKEELMPFLWNDRFTKWLPQFRFIEGETYRQLYREGDQMWQILLTPNLTVKHQDSRCSYYRLWCDSFFLNMHETWQLFSGEKSYGESVALHVDGLVSPKDRLTDNCKRELKENLGLFDYTPDSPSYPLPPTTQLV